MLFVTFSVFLSFSTNKKLNSRTAAETGLELLLFAPQIQFDATNRDLKLSSSLNLLLVCSECILLIQNTGYGILGYVIYLWIPLIMFIQEHDKIIDRIITLLKL